jgi:putative acetyltransferase
LDSAEAERTLTWIKQPTERLLAATPEVRTAVPLFRLEEQADIQPIREILEASFPGFGEADLVDNLRRDGDLVLSIVAEDEGIVIGSVCFSRLWIEGGEKAFPAVALAPLAVYPEYQQQGVATRMVREAHACLAAMGETLSIVLGEPSYYSRFGYSHHRAANFTSDYQSPYLMGLSFGAAPSEGRLIYPRAFAALSEDAPLQADDRV